MQPSILSDSLITRLANCANICCFTCTPTHSCALYPSTNRSECNGVIDAVAKVWSDFWTPLPDQWVASLWVWMMEEFGRLHCRQRTKCKWKRAKWGKQRRSFSHNLRGDLCTCASLALSVYCSRQLSCLWLFCGKVRQFHQYSVFIHGMCFYDVQCLSLLTLNYAL